MHGRVVWAAGVSAVLILLGGCAEAPSRGELVEALETSGIPEAKAECAADAVIDELTEDEIVEIVARGPAGAPRDDPDASDDASDRVRAALAECQQVGAETTSTTELPPPPPSTPGSIEGDPSTSAPGGSSTTVTAGSTESTEPAGSTPSS